MPLPPGLVVGPAVGEDALGRWRRTDGPDGPGALRSLHERLAGQHDARLLFAEEVRRVATLDHPALLRVRAHDAGDGVPWMLTEPVDGPSLAALAGPGRGLPPEEALALLGHLVGGLEALAARRQFHASPVAARVVRVGATWKWLTFRDVRAFDEVRTLKGRPFADEAWRPPELDRGDRNPAERAGFLAWTVGALARHLLGGGPPRGADGALAPLAAGVFAAFAPALSRLLDPHPRHRPPTLGAAMDLLRSAAAGAGSAGPAPASARSAPVPRRRRP
jgi:hypothetical protein